MEGEREFPSRVEMPAAELTMLIGQHKRNRALTNFLKTTDFLEGDFIRRRETRGLRIVEIREYCSPFHAACWDPDGSRGEEKIRVLLEAAKHFGLHLSYFLVTGEKCERHSRLNPSVPMISAPPLPGHQRNREETTSVTVCSCITPLHILVNNPESTVESFRLLCQACPEIVHIRNACKECIREATSDTILMSLLKRGGESTTDTQRRVAIMRVFLEAAERTAKGAKSLVAAGEIVEEGVGMHLRETADNALYYATTSQYNPDQFIPSLLHAWPDALKFCSGAVTPLHAIADFKRTPQVGSYQARMKSIEELMTGSSPKALAFALLFPDREGRTGLFLSMKAIKDMSHDDSVELQEHMDAVFRTLVRKKDDTGRTLLHYVAAHRAEVNEDEFDVKAEGILERGRDPTEGQLTQLQVLREELKERNASDVLGVCEWILKIDPSTGFIRDSHGMTPFHFAIAEGKRWDTGLSGLAELCPDWCSANDGVTGLFPFMSAASKEYIADDNGDQTETIFELLRSNPPLAAVQEDRVDFQEPKPRLAKPYYEGGQWVIHFLTGLYRDIAIDSGKREVVYGIRFDVPNERGEDWEEDWPEEEYVAGRSLFDRLQREELLDFDLSRNGLVTATVRREWFLYLSYVLCMFSHVMSISIHEPRDLLDEITALKGRLVDMEAKHAALVKRKKLENKATNMKQPAKAAKKKRRRS